MIIFLSMIIKFFTAFIKNVKTSQVATVPCCERSTFPFFRPKKCVGMVVYIFSIFAVLL